MILTEIPEFEVSVPVAIVGAGACGLTAALAARDTGAEVLVLERDASPSGSTALSSGFVPACGTCYQRAVGIEDDAATFSADIIAKTKGRAVRALVDHAVAGCGPALEWLDERHGLEWEVLDGFLYPGHSRHRMHAVPERTGAALMARLAAAADAAGVDVLTSATVTALYVEGETVRGVRVGRPDGTQEAIGLGALVLASNGFGGNPDLVARHLPEMADALYFGHQGNRGDALLWGEALGAATAHLSGYQGHGSVAEPHGVLITWALMMEGAIQVNAAGERFSNEHEGYSEQAVQVIAQPGGIAWNVLDEPRHALGLTFPDYRDAVEAGAVREAASVEALAGLIGCEVDALQTTLEAARRAHAGEADRFGRDFTKAAPLEPPFRAVKVTGALFHTQGGLMIDDEARVLNVEGRGLPNLFAGGGAACGVSGPDVSGYLSGNGLLTAIAFGRSAGRAAARQARGEGGATRAA